jgi:uncharacterized protein
MERESFEDEEVAELLNREFVSIKVDREERPDIDSIYMTACQMLTGSGGWPLTILMTPEKLPFFAGTYFPKKSKYGRSGLIDLLNSASKAWKEKRKDLIKTSQAIRDNIENHTSRYTPEEIGKETLLAAYDELKAAFTEKYGGFSTAPKFPIPHTLSFLLRFSSAYNDKASVAMVEKTLTSMYKGGIFDHIGGGFSRYSTDEKWLVPHFEKMLYDNALLSYVYLQCFSVTKNNFYSTVAKRIFEYVLNKMTSEEGGFYSAEDADSEGVEGKFYVWDYEEIIKLLGNDRGIEFSDMYDITHKGNFEGKSIPNLIEKDIKGIDIGERIQKGIEELFSYREKRVHPYKDDKILTAWNGLMIASLSYGGRILEELLYTNAAKKAVDFIYKNLFNDKGRLLVRFREGESANLAYVDDYAFLTYGLIELYETTFETIYLKEALKLAEDMLELFFDESRGGFYLYGKDSESLIARPKEIYDGAVPSGNSVAAFDLIKLYSITGNMDFQKRAEDIFKAFGENVNNSPSSYTFLLSALMMNINPSRTIVIAGSRGDALVEQSLKEISSRFMPFTNVIVYSGEHELEELISDISSKVMINGKTSIYICENFACRKPIQNIEEFKRALESKNNY